MNDLTVRRCVLCPTLWPAGQPRRATWRTCEPRLAHLDSAESDFLRRRYHRARKVLGTWPRLVAKPEEE